jgi:hypothetical protein
MANVSDFVKTLDIADIKSFLQICHDDVYVAADHTIQSCLKDDKGNWCETVELGERDGVPHIPYRPYIFGINRSTLDHCTYFDVVLKSVPTKDSKSVADETAEAVAVSPLPPPPPPLPPTTASINADILAQPLFVFMETPLLYGPYQMSEGKPQIKYCEVLSKYKKLFRKSIYS